MKKPLTNFKIPTNHKNLPLHPINQHLFPYQKFITTKIYVKIQPPAQKPIIFDFEKKID